MMLKGLSGDKFNTVDRMMMFQALSLAEEGLYSTHPNPRVG